MKATKEVTAALMHVRIFYPDVTMVVFNKQGQWQYFTDNFEVPTFDDRIDVGLLEDACDSVSVLPAVFNF